MDVAHYIPIVLASANALPTAASIQGVLDDVAAAEARGYFLPDEDEKLRDVFAVYLAVRSSLLECVSDVSGGTLSTKGTKSLHEFIVAYAAACLLVRSANFIVSLACKYPIGRKKLDEPESRYGLDAKNFAKIYKSLTSPKRWGSFFEAVRFFHAHREEIVAYKTDPVVGPVVELIIAEEAYVVARRRDFLKRRLDYRMYSFLRRNHSGYKKTMFKLFKISGSAIAELKQPFVKPSGAGKRVTADVRDRLETFLQPGDVLVTRHDDALSNLFLPGFWPHAAFYIGSQDERETLGVQSEHKIEDRVRFLEAKKDGVKLRPPEDTLQVDAFTVLRPTLSATHRAEAVSRGLTHAGKLYDFTFDFSVADRLACTELVYRSYHSVADIAFALQPHAGRHCLSAEDLLNQAIEQGWFEPVLVFGVRGNDWIEGDEARTVQKQSSAAQF
ncbi:MAG: YiiX/YebB-like N1pC/P60 family cysteine hydrolase [Kiritimatiellae bacterium]|nr:YiiX/YebB-like N1pC/P60 family cysteine hydrolase [Kiritimatiellia bacterium]